MTPEGTRADVSVSSTEAGLTPDTLAEAMRDRPPRQPRPQDDEEERGPLALRVGFYLLFFGLPLLQRLRLPFLFPLLLVLAFACFAAAWNPRMRLWTDRFLPTRLGIAATALGLGLSVLLAWGGGR